MLADQIEIHTSYHRHKKQIGSVEAMLCWTKGDGKFYLFKCTPLDCKIKPFLNTYTILALYSHINGNIPFMWKTICVSSSSLPRDCSAFVASHSVNAFLTGVH